MWYRLYRRLFFRPVGTPGVLDRLLGRLIPRHCFCGRRTRALQPFCDLHRGEPHRPGDVNP